MSVQLLQQPHHTPALAIEEALKGGQKLSRYDRYNILEKTRHLLVERKEEFAQIISAESGLAIREARYETGRAHDVLLFAAIESLKDDGQIFPVIFLHREKQEKYLPFVNRFH